MKEKLLKIIDILKINFKNKFDPKAMVEFYN